MAVRYIGSKARVVDAILDVVGEPHSDAFFVDALCGTGVVAEEAARRGWPVRVNDHLYCSMVMAAARLTARPAVPFTAFGGYKAAVAILDRVKPREGFIWREYTPASVRFAGVQRQYFTEMNGARIDGLRATIADWRAIGQIGETEERLLIADLLAAVNRVANIAGTYGCFLSTWAPNARQPLELRPRPLITETVPIEAFNRDVLDVPAAIDDVAYFDPPYTKRQYAAYYHVLETVSVGDEPDVEGITGLRPWQTKASPFCYKARALTAIVELVRSVAARRVVLSYSSEGHVDLEDLVDALAPFGALDVHELGELGRYRPNLAASNAGSSVREFLLDLVKEEAGDLVEAA